MYSSDSTYDSATSPLFKMITQKSFYGSLHCMGDELELITFSDKSPQNWSHIVITKKGKFQPFNPVSSITKQKVFNRPF